MVLKLVLNNSFRDQNFFIDAVVDDDNDDDYGDNADDGGSGADSCL